MNEILSVLGRTSIQGGIALVVVWLLCRLLRRLPANLHCWLWRFAFLRCLAGLFLALTIAIPILPQASPVDYRAVGTPTDHRVVEGQPVLIANKPMAEPVMPAIAPTVSAAPSTPAASSVEISVTSHSKLTRSWIFWLTLLYCIGLVFAVVRLLAAGQRMRRMIQRATVTEYPALPELAGRFGCRCVPRLVRSAEVTTPMLAFGTILLSEDITANEYLVLAHELAHFRRRDLAWEWLGIVTQTILWFHPLVWLARREERLARELAADALAVAVIADAHAAYAHALLTVSLQRSGDLPTFAVGAVEGGSRLRLRLEALARPNLSRRRALVLGMVACILAAVAFLPWRAVARQTTRTSSTTWCVTINGTETYAKGHLHPAPGGALRP